MAFIKAKVSPGESLSFSSSKARTVPFTNLGFNNCKHFKVGSYKSKSKYANETINS